jgi:hypothetical protein
MWVLEEQIAIRQGDLEPQDKPAKLAHASCRRERTRILLARVAMRADAEKFP